MQIRSASYNPVQQVAAGDQIAGAQVAWMINPITGNDAGFGTPEFPLKTMAEFNRRYQSVLVTVAATLQLVGDVIDTPLSLSGTRFALGASLSVFGTRTVTNSNIVVSSVTQLGDAGVGEPFQLVTTGINWTTVPLGSRVTITASGTAANVNTFTFIVSVTDANTVIVGQFCTGLSTSVGIATPTANDVLSVSALSRAYSPQLNAEAVTISQQPVATFFATAITIRDLVLGGGFPLMVTGNANADIIGCEILQEPGPGSAFGQTTIRVRSQVAFLACRFTQNFGLLTLSCSNETSVAINCVMACDSAIKTNRWTLQGGWWQIARNAHNNCALRSGGGTLIEVNGAINIRNTQLPCFFEEFTRIWALGKISGSAGNTDTGMRVQSGTGYAWNGSANKPNVTGVSPGVSDILVGGTTLSYAALGTGYYAAFNNANPNSILNLVGPGGGCWAAQF